MCAARVELYVYIHTCARARTYTCERADEIVCEWVQLGATLRAVTAAVNIANTGRPRLASTARSVRYMLSRAPPHLFPILFYPRAPPRMSNRYVRPSARPPVRYSPPLRHDRSARRYRDRELHLVCCWAEFEMNSPSCPPSFSLLPRSLSDCAIRAD